MVIAWIALILVLAVVAVLYWREWRNDLLSYIRLGVFYARRIPMRFYIGLILLVIVILLLLLSGCVSSSTADYNLTDPNVPYRFTGRAADIIAETVSKNMQTVQGRENALLESLVPYYGFLFLFGLGGVAACILMAWLGISIGKFLWIVPVVCFAGMAFIHFWSAYAKPISLCIGILVVGLFVWKVVEYKWERNAKKEKAK